MRFPRHHSLRAFTLLELLVVLVAVILLIAFLIPATLKAKAKSQRIQCVNNLKNVGLGHRVFWLDATNSVTAQKSFSKENEILQNFLSLTNEITSPHILACPADTRKPSTNWNNFSRQNLSYFVSPAADETYPQSFLSGDRNLATNGIPVGPGRVKFEPNNPPTWYATQHRFQGNAVMGDGSVQQLSASRMNQQLADTTNVFLFP